MNLTDRTILITGGTSGIGKQLVAQLAPLNRKVIVVARDKVKLALLQGQFENVETLACPLHDQEAIRLHLSKILNFNPNLSVIINNAAVQNTPYILSEEFDVESVEPEIAVNFCAPVNICALAARSFVNKSQSTALVNITSGLALYPKTSGAVYCATKAALHSFSQSLRYQLEDTNIQIYEALLPLVETPMTHGRGAGKISPQFAAREIIRGVNKGIVEHYIGKAKWIPIISKISVSLMKRILKSG